MGYTFRALGNIQKRPTDETDIYWLEGYAALSDAADARYEMHSKCGSGLAREYGLPVDSCIG